MEQRLFHNLIMLVVWTCIFSSPSLSALELAEPVHYGSEINGVRVVLDIVLPKQTDAQREQTEQLLQTVTIPWLPAGETWKQRVVDKQKSMLENILALRKEFPNNASAKQWYSDSVIETTWHTDTFISLRARNVSFTGGAHSTSDMQAIIINLTANRIMTLTDIIDQNNHEALSALLTTQYKKRKNIPSEAKLRDHGLQIDVLPVRLPYFTDTGIAVTYPPYEIAPFAAGSITVNVPREEVVPLLKFNPWAGKE